MTQETETTPTKSLGSVLIVEDDQFLARALTSKLKKEGFKVTTVRNGQQALDALHKEVPDMMLLDLIMPQKDGFAVLEEVRAQPKTKNLKVIVLSNLGQESDTAATKKLGALEHLVKADTPLAEIVRYVKKHMT